ncbi:MAG: hypothetical protein IKW90_06520 [Lachnospiraceae bacterium]|nr:hypothetical protein [Lachnospiraceae bacterium]
MINMFALASFPDHKIFALILGTTALETLIILIIAIYNLIRICFQKSKRAYTMLFSVLVLIEYLIFQVFLYIIAEFKDSKEVGFDNKTVELILLQSAVTIVVLAMTQTVRRWEKRSVTKASLKEGLDSLPVGLLFYWKGGMVKLVNTKMDSISRSLTGKGIYSGTEFWDMLVSKDMNIFPDKNLKDKADNYSNIVNADDYQKKECIVRLEDGSVYSFKQSICIFEGHELVEIMATDISQEQLLNEKLKVKRVKVDEIKKRLQSLNSEIETMTVQKEILATKSKVHDDLGKTLIMTRRYLETQDESLGDDIIKQWKLNTMLLRGEENENNIFEYSTLAKDFSKMGLQLEVTGMLPKRKEHKDIIITGLRTCATNALKHGNAKTMFVKITNTIGRTLTSFKEKQYLQVEISNDGEIPSADNFSEGGGLGNLRKAVERIGGNMNVECGTEFKVIFRMPLLLNTK